MPACGRLTPGALWSSVTSSSGFGYGSAFSSTPSTTLKMAVFAPMPIASVNTATAVKPGIFASRRRM